jgi:hypothetical protein
MFISVFHLVFLPTQTSSPSSYSRGQLEDALAFLLGRDETTQNWDYKATTDRHSPKLHQSINTSAKWFPMVRVPTSSMRQSPGFENHEFLVLKLWVDEYKRSLGLGLVNAVVLTIENTKYKLVCLKFLIPDFNTSTSQKEKLKYLDDFILM